MITVKGVMNQKVLVPVILFLVVGVASAVGLSVWSQSSRKNLGEKKPIGTMVDQKVSDSQAVLVVKTFCENFFQGPPALNEAGVIRALSLLSQKATNSISTIGPSPSAALASFAGVQDVPDQGYTIDEISEEAEKATIKTTWKYSSGPVSKTFDLEKENGSWKINSIY